MSNEEESEITSFQLTEGEGYKIVRLNADLDADGAKIFLAQITALISKLKAPVYIVVDCEKVPDLHLKWLRAFNSLHHNLLSVKKQLRLISVQPSLRKLIEKAHLDLSLKMAPNLRSALLELGLSSFKKLDVNFINPFLTATMQVLKTQTSTECKPGVPYRRADNDKFIGDISGVIGLVSDAFSGSVVISFPAASFLKIMSRMIGEECTEINKDIEDGAAELTNIIFGQAKVVLNEKGYGIKSALPSVICGKNHSITAASGGPRMAIPFTTDVGDFVIEICLSE